MTWQRVRVVGSSSLAIACGLLFYHRYWKWRDCIAEAASSCITPDGSNLTSGGLIWGILAAVLSAAALRLILKS